MKKVIQEVSGWKRMVKDEELKHWDIEEIITWYYNNKLVDDVQIISIEGRVVAYITLETSSSTNLTDGDGKK